MGAPGPRPHPRPIHLHIGAMKTGTTFLQRLMEANRGALAAHGYLFPGEEWADQVLAVRDLMGSLRGRPPAAGTEGRWAQLTAEMLAHPGPSILSMEFLSFADERRAAAVLDSFGEREVHVVLTIRDARGALPAQWQTRCRVGGTEPWPRFVRDIVAAVETGAGGGRPGRVFRRAQDIPRMLDVWVPQVGADRVHVVTVPPRGTDPMLLWRRFAEAVGVDPSVCAPAPIEHNPSLGHPSAELLRRIHVGLGGSLPKESVAAVVRDVLARDLERRAGQEPPVRLGPDGLAFATRWNQRVRDAVRASGVRVVGSLDDLPTSLPPGRAPPESPTADQLLAAAVDARASLLRLAAPSDEHSAPDRPDRWSAAPDPVAAAVAELTDLVRRCARP